MYIVRFRKEEDAKHLLKRVKKMREEIEEVEDCLKECIKNEDDVDFRDDYDSDDDDRNYRRARRMRSEDERYRRM